MKRMILPSHSYLSTSRRFSSHNITTKYLKSPILQERDSSYNYLIPFNTQLSRFLSSAPLIASFTTARPIQNEPHQPLIMETKQSERGVHRRRKKTETMPARSSLEALKIVIQSSRSKRRNAETKSVRSFKWAQSEVMR